MIENALSAGGFGVILGTFTFVSIAAFSPLLFLSFTTLALAGWLLGHAAVCAIGSIILSKRNRR